MKQKIVNPVKRRLVQYTHFVGIDPGKTGAIVAMDQKTDTIVIADCPVDIKNIPSAFDKALEALPGKEMNILFCVEKIGGRPGERGSTAFVKNAGIWLGQCYRFGDTIEVHPRTWMTLYKNIPAWSRYKHAAGTNKIRAHETALSLFQNRLVQLCIGRGTSIEKMPIKEALAGTRGGIKDGRCDALLIANYARCLKRNLKW